MHYHPIHAKIIVNKWKSLLIYFVQYVIKNHDWGYHLGKMTAKVGQEQTS